jgi:membrane protein DedA with SNARE-associated domain
MEGFAHALADFVRDHQAWAAPIVLVLAFGESLAFISLLIPAWGALVAIGAMLGGSGINFWPVWIAGAIGAALGDWLSYWFGYRYKEQVAHMWPLSRYPEILPRGKAFVEKWGVPSIFIGRFFGPLRASVPLAGRNIRDGVLALSNCQLVSAPGLGGGASAVRRRARANRQMDVGGIV